MQRLAAAQDVYVVMVEHSAQSRMLIQLPLMCREHGRREVRA